MTRRLIVVALAVALILVFPNVFIKGGAINYASPSSVESGAIQTNLMAGTPESTPISLNMLVLVNSTVYVGVKESLERYENDLEDFGFEDVIIMNWSDPNPANIRSTLQHFYSNNTLAGVLLVGDLPAAEYEMFTEWDYERFSTDLYYMDLDGNWTDSDDDGTFDEHVGNIAPEIWVGRIKTSQLGEDEVLLINDYFEKNHQYRIGSLYTARRALLYLDDDWVNYEIMDSYSIGLLYKDTTVVTEKTTTNETDYKNRLRQGYEWVQLRSHGSWNRHNFMTPGGDGGIVYSSEYAETNPQALFYNLFVCSAARFTQPEYLAGEVVFNTDYGLLALSSTKVGGMLLCWTFYEAIARGKTVGDAFKEWFVKWGEGKYGLSGYYAGRKWSYGMTIIGDPTLRLRWLGENEIAELQKLEEEVIDDLPLVQNLQQRIFDSELDYTSLSGDYSNLSRSYLTLQNSHGKVETQLEDIKSLLYFFLLTTTILLIFSVYSVKSKPKSKTIEF